MASKKVRKQAPKRPQKPMAPKSFSEQDVKLTQDVKRANQRLRELEKQGMENSPAYKAVERLATAGDKAITMGTHTDKEGKQSKVIKFDTNIRKLNYNQRRHLEAQVRRFLESESSTTKGAKAIVDRAKKAYREKSEKLGLNENKEKPFDYWMNIWNTAIVKEYKAMYGSDETHSIIIELYNSSLDYGAAIAFLENMFGKPYTTITDAIPYEDMDAGTGDKDFDWDAIFTAGDDDLPF